MGNQNSQNLKFQFIALFSSNTEQIQDNLINILRTPFTQDQYLEAFYPSDIRHVLKQDPNKIAYLLQCLYEFLTQDKGQTVEKFNIYKNCARLITSIIPILYEPEFKEQLYNFLWLNKIQKENEDVQPEDPPLMICFLKSLISLCFVCGFTIHDQETEENVLHNDELLNIFGLYYCQHFSNYQIQNQIIWKGFLVQCKYPHDQYKYYENRYIILSALLALISQTLYFPSHSEFYHYISKEPQKQSMNEQQEVQQQDDGDQQDHVGITPQIVKTQIPNATLLAMQKMPYFPELLVSILAVALFPNEGYKAIAHNIIPIHSKLVTNLNGACLRLSNLILIGQSTVVNLTQLYNDEERIDLYCAFKHFEQNQSQFPSLLSLKENIKERLLIEASSRLYQYYKSQQKLIRNIPLDNIVNFENLFILFAYLMLGAKYKVQYASEVLLLSTMYEPALQGNQLKIGLKNTHIISEIAQHMLLVISQHSTMCHQLNQKIDFVLSQDKYPILTGSWSDLLFVSGCNNIMRSIPITQKFLKTLDQYTVIWSNISNDIISINDKAVFMLCQLLKALSQYNLYLSSPIVPISVHRIFYVIHNILCNNSELYQVVLRELMIIAQILQAFTTISITDSKIKLYWHKYFGNEQANQSFMLSKPQQLGQELDRREQSLRAETQVQTKIHNPQKLDEQKNQEQEIEIESDKAQQKYEQQQEQIQVGDDNSISPQIDQQEIDIQRLFLECWKSFDHTELLKNSTIHNLIAILRELSNNKVTHCQELSDYLINHDIGQLLQRKPFFREHIDPIVGFERIGVATWTLWLQQADRFPYFEKVLCPFYLSELKKYEQ